MRLICPNCNAQYDVEASVIPENGRDVQCSNCGHTWYQRPGSKESDLAEPEDDSVDEEQDSEPTPPEIEAEATPAVEEPPQDDENDQEDMPDAEEEVLSEEMSSEPDNEPDNEVVVPKRSALDEEVTGILQEEANRETAARVADAEGVESKPNPGLDDLPINEDAGIQNRMARLRGLDDDLGASVAAAAVSGAARKDLLPDIEEINSSLTASAQEVDEGTEQAQTERKARSGFRRGFALTIIFFGVLLLVYLFAPKIAEMFPAAKSALSAYVDWVNALRTSVDQMMLRAVDKLTTIVTQINGSDPG